ncbi:MAG: hypothetical protein IJ053_03670, partial [Lachnospiraceae bacterium]|nr:hypothetical protein [Lachnospiraceae bacterium]
MATKKSTKRNKRKHGRRYMKRAARRTVAALLMVTALIVADIPATPSRAQDSGKLYTTYTATDNNYHMYYFEKITEDGVDGLALVGVKDTDTTRA